MRQSQHRPWEDADRLVAWAGSDTPVVTEADDYFGHCSIAIRIAERLARGIDDPGQLPSFVLYGPHGAGKTSIFNLVQEQLVQETGTRRVILTHVKAWEFTDENAIINAVLKAMVDALASHAPTIALQQVPAHYLSAIGALGGWRAAIARLLGASAAPRSLVELIADAATTCHIRIVVWVDDLERFRRQSRQHDATVKALLGLIREAPGLSFVLAEGIQQAGDELGHEFDYSKLGDHIEVVPPPDPDTVCEIVGVYRAQRMLPPHSTCIDPSAESDRDAITRAYSNPWLLRDTGLGRLHAIASVLATPRLLKSFIRNIDCAWNALKGEIDPDDLIVLHALRASEHMVFLQTTGWSASFAPLDILLRRDLVEFLRSERKIDEQQRPRTPPEVVALAEYVSKNASHPVVVLLNSLTAPQAASPKRPQAISGRDYTDYLIRALSERIDDVRDQSVLALIDAWTVDRHDGMTDFIDELLSSQAMVTKALQFSNRFTAESATRLLEHTVARSITRPYGDDHCKRVIKLAAILMERRRDPADARERRLVALISQSLAAERLELARSLLEECLGDHDLGLSNDGHRALQRIFAHDLPQQYDSERISRALERAENSLLNWLLMGCRCRQIGPIPVDDRRALVHLLLAATGSALQRVARVLAAIIAATERVPGQVELDGWGEAVAYDTYNVTVRMSDLRLLCGDRYREALRVLAEIDPDVAELPAEQEALRAVRKQSVDELQST